VKFTAYGKTDIGVKRTKNEDHFCSDEDLGLFIVADGIGGHAGGEIASTMAVEVIRDYMKMTMTGKEHGAREENAHFTEETNRVAAGIRRANQSIYESSQKDPALHGMGTTVAVALLTGNKLSIAHVGDSRIYLVREHSLFPLTDDHSVVSEQMKLGLITKEEAETSQFGNVITKALGYEETIAMDLNELDIIEGDRIVLCTDGLTRMVSEDIIFSTVSSVDKHEEACKILIDTACANGGKDNITVIVIHILQDGWLSRLKKYFR
jgi:serine/threonine protein phosphatase PrpC